jgi:hypothetical protein
MADPSATATERKALIRLLRHLLADGPAKISRKAESNEVELAFERSPPRNYGENLLQKARSLGLIAESHERISATPSAKTFLRRALLSVEQDGFQDQHRQNIADTLIEEGSRRTVRRNLLESPLSILSRIKDRSGKGFFPADAIEAGERLMSDFTRGQLQPRVTASWEPRLAAKSRGGAGGQAELADSAMAARLRFSRAVEAIGPELSGVAIDVCCFEKGIEAVEHDRQWPARSAKLMLRTALLVLARHYRPQATGAQAAHARHWGTADFRPEIRRT